MVRDMSSRQKAPVDSWSTNRSHPDREDWVELAVDSGKASLVAQRDELSGMRTRAVAFGALTVSASAFLVGTGLGQADRSNWFFLVAGIGTLLFAVLAALLIAMVSPAFKFRFILDPRALIAWMEGDAPAPSRKVAMRKLAAETIPGMIDDNEKSLEVVRRLYRGVLVAAVATLGVWVALVWVFA